MVHTILKTLIQLIMAFSVGSAGYAVLCFAKKGFADFSFHNAFVYAFFVYCAFILALTLTPSPSTSEDNFTLFKTIIHTFTEARPIVRIVAYLNTALLIPMGIFLTRTFRLSFPASALICILVPVFIELTQFALPFNRVFDVDDILLNSLGGIIGSVIGRLSVKRA